MAYGKMLRPVLLALLIISITGLASNSQVALQGDTKTELESLKAEINVMKAEIIILQKELEKVKSELESYKSQPEYEYPPPETDERAHYRDRDDNTTYVANDEVAGLLKEYYEFYRRDYEYKDVKIKRLGDAIFQISMMERHKATSLVRFPWSSVVRTMYVNEYGTVSIVDDYGY